MWNVLLAEAAATPGVWQEPSKEYIKYLADKGAMKTIMQEVKHVKICNWFKRGTKRLEVSVRLNTKSA
eukprot:8381931-Lingulodinium_polyedra.AAC.1